MLETVEGWASEGLRVIAVASRELEHDTRQQSLSRKISTCSASSPCTTRCALSRAGRRPQRDEPVSPCGCSPAIIPRRPARSAMHSVSPMMRSSLARPRPDKLDLVEALQASGEVVAVTGDGVNDAPALRRADVGVAMGRSGTEAAREAASIVLTDDDFATIVAAVAEGRRIGDNIRKFVAFLLSANFGEVLVFAVVIGAGLGTPLAVIQVLLVNLVTDGLPALALAQDPADEATMSSPPRTSQALFDTRTWLNLIVDRRAGRRHDDRRVRARSRTRRRDLPDNGLRDPLHSPNSPSSTGCAHPDRRLENAREPLAEPERARLRARRRRRRLPTGRARSVRDNDTEPRARRWRSSCSHSCLSSVSRFTRVSDTASIKRVRPVLNRRTCLRRGRRTHSRRIERGRGSAATIASEIARLRAPPATGLRGSGLAVT